MRNLDGWMTERMMERMDGKDDHHHRNQTKPRILYIKIYYWCFSLTCIVKKKLSLSKQGVCHTVALPFTLKRILRQKKNYGNSNISPCKNIFFKKSTKRNQNPSRYYNFITNFKFQHKPKYHLTKILI
jgi:hypothetical protein